MRYKVMNADVHGEDLELIVRESDSMAIESGMLDLITDTVRDHPDVAMHLFSMLAAMQESKDFRSAVQA